ncbi:hypothetical protein GJ496_010631 [Pomphorhynchus laevis]|nr:hypothetical protein GJ496_010631 [Pomphorhynchus laevis]
MPTWVLESSIVRDLTRQTKSDQLVHPVDIISSAPLYALIRYRDGRESTVSTSDLAPRLIETENGLPSTDLPQSQE